MYSKTFVNSISFIFTVIIFCTINIFGSKVSSNDSISIKEQTEKSNNFSQNIATEANNSTKENQEIVQEEKMTEKEEKIANWKIEIPEILLVAQIEEGTTKEILDKYVGHFEITPKTEGNIGLAAHNRGYPVNYFENLKELRGGEEIIYTYGDNKKTYVVTKNIKISDIDWSYLENTPENKLTLITCIANEPAYRRCVQATEKLKEENN